MFDQMNGPILALYFFFLIYWLIIFHRYDRIMTSLSETTFKPIRIEIIGNKHINRVSGVEVDNEETSPQVVFDSFSTPPHKNARLDAVKADDDQFVYPSDHFGLLAEFEVCDTDDATCSST